MGFSRWTFLFQVVNFVALAFILHRLLYRPLHEAIDRRRREDARALDEAAKAREEAESLRKALEERVAEIESRRAEMLRQAREQAGAERQKLLDETARALERRGKEAEESWRREREEAVRSLQSELVGSAVRLAERLLRDAADVSLQERLADRLVETLREVPDDERERLRRGWEAEERAVVETAAPFNGPTLDRLRTAAAELAGRPVDLAVRERPDLIAGARFRLGGHVWDACLADALDQARRGVAEGGPP
jgi:F-type H+-transporting ATPase subunit b